MNDHVPHTPRSPTQAAEGLPRWRWTTAELENLAKLGAFTDEDRFELIGGEIVPMSPKGRRHEIVREELAFRLGELASRDTRIVSEPQLNLADDAYTNPDIVVRPLSILMPDVRGPTALLVIEISDTSQRYDCSVKAPLYASYGVREYWVIDAWSLETTVHLDPNEGRYANVIDVAPNDRLTPSLAPAPAIRLDGLGLGDA